MKNLTLISALLFFAFSQVLAQTDSSNSKKVLQEIVILGIQANGKLPITFSTLDQKRLNKLYYGADIPTLLSVTPSINMYSDNGTGIGYSFFRLRGMDQTRINTTVNGIPVNDPENQGVFFNNFADLSSSIDQIQIQRGIGTSTNGTSAFGGSVSITTKHLSETPDASVHLGIGSFGSRRFTAEIQTGLIEKHWLFYGRIGQVKTDGYRQNSGSESKSYQFSLGYIKNKSLLKFNFFGGNSKSVLSYVGIDKTTFQNNPKTNNFSNGESDAFEQYFNQVQYSYQLKKGQTLSASIYFVKGGAPKFQYLAEGWYDFNSLNMLQTPYALNGNSDTLYPGNVMTSYRLNQNYLGGFVNYQIQKGKLNFVSGLHANSFSSDHFMEVNSANTIPVGIAQNHQVYFNTGFKKELSAFTKFNYAINSNTSLFADLQIRTTSFKYKSKEMQFRPNDGKVEDMSWTFLNPKIGSRFIVSKTISAHAMAGYSQREPTRFDYFQDDFAVRDVKQNEIKPEQVVDIEMGTEFNGKIKGKLNLFAMEFQNQIVSTGALNNFGYSVTGNVGKSFRRGIELDLNGKITSHISYWISSSISKNEITKLNQTYENTDQNIAQNISYENTSLALSPNQIHNLGLESNFLKGHLLLAGSIRYVSMQYLDNTQNKDLSIPSFQTLDFQIGFDPKEFNKKGIPRISLRINNILDAKYAPSGSIGGYNSIDNNGVRGQNALLLPAANRNLFCTLNWFF